MKMIYIFRMFIMASFIMSVKTLDAMEPEMFRIEFMNCKKIQIGKEWLRTKETFMSDKVIQWENGRQYMRVRSLRDPNMVFGITYEGFKEMKVKTLYEFLVKTKSTSTRGKLFSRHYSQVRHYLVDTLLFQAYDEPQSDIVTEAVWLRPDGREKVTRLQRTTDNTFYIVNRNILDQGTIPDSLLLDIRERSSNDDWINRIYRQIPIICLPTTVK